MLSKKIRATLALMTESAPTPKDRASVQSLANTMQEQASKSACLRCAAATFFIELDGKHQFHFYLGACGRFVALQHPEGQPGLDMPMNRFWCSSEAAEVESQE